MLYRYIEKEALPLPRVILGSLLAGITTAVPTTLLNMLASAYLQKNMELVPPELAALIVQVTESSDDFVSSFLSIAIVAVPLSVVGGVFHHLLRSQRTQS